MPQDPTSSITSSLASTILGEPSTSTSTSTSAQNPFTRPPFQPTTNPPQPPTFPFKSQEWIHPLSIPVHFSLPVFFSTLKDLILHPERNSTLILRADPLPLRVEHNELELDSNPEIGTFEKTEEMRVRLLPKMPKRDGRLEQKSVFLSE